MQDQGEKDREKENLRTNSPALQQRKSNLLVASGLRLPSLASSIAASPQQQEQQSGTSSASAAGLNKHSAVYKTVDRSVQQSPLLQLPLPPQCSTGLASIAQPRKSIGMPTYSSPVGVRDGRRPAFAASAAQPSSPPPLPPKRLCQSLSLHAELLRPVPLRPGALAGDLESLLCLGQRPPPPAPPQSLKSSRKRRVLLTSRSRSFLVGLPDVASSDSIVGNQNLSEGSFDQERKYDSVDYDDCAANSDSDSIAEASEFLDLELIERDL